MAKAFSVDGGPASRAVSVPLPDGASFTTATYANAAGSRDYRLYIPSIRNGERLPLIVILHGCTQSPDDFAVGTQMNRLAEEHGFLGEPYPAQHPLANARQCWNWFKPDDQRRSWGGPSLISGITREVMRDADRRPTGRSRSMANRNRPHQGRWCFGKTPMQPFLDAKPIAEEKRIAA
jgi:hypothetical protein